MTPLQQRLLQLLQQQPQGLGEYECLKTLQTEQQDGFPKIQFSDQMALFRQHFQLYHALYHLQQLLWQQQRGHLDISALQIRLRPYQAGEARLSLPDLLRDYYLDIGNLETMSEAELSRLLGQFWAKFRAQDSRQMALQTLELSEPVDYPQIKQQYRRLAMRHHPDRGGDTVRLQAINDAMAILDTYYR